MEAIYNKKVDQQSVKKTFSQIEQRYNNGSTFTFRKRKAIKTENIQR
jgi:hypothetical protein